MIHNYMILAIRSLAKNKLTVLINVIGISIALAYGLLALLFVHNEWTYDQFHEQADRIYRICLKSINRVNANTPGPLGPAFANEFAGLKTARAYHSRGNAVKGKNSFSLELRYVDPEFLEIFSFPLARGNAALHDVQSILITGKTAQKLFPNTDPVGQTITLRPTQWMSIGGSPAPKDKDYIVSGILKDIPENSSLQFDGLLPFEAATDTHLNIWGFTGGTSTFVMLPKAMVLQQVQDRLPDIGKTLADQAKYPRAFQFFLQPLKDIHFDQSVRGPEPVSNPTYSYVLAGIALIIILVVATNFSALTIGISSTRSKEVGLRKLFGAHRQQLIGQYLGESIILSFLALGLGIALAKLMLPTFNALMGKELAVKYIDLTTILYASTLTLTIGAISGFYPALILSRFQTVEILSARLATLKPTFFLRILLILQFALSTMLLIGAFTMTRQIDLLKNKDLGFYIDNVIVISTFDLRKISPNAIDVYKDKIVTYPQIIGTTRVGHALSNSTRIRGFFKVDEKVINGVAIIDVGYNFVKTMNLKLLEGRNFSRVISTDKNNAIIINEAFVKHLGWKNGAGQVFSDRNGNGPATVVGVVKDFHFRSLHHTVAPAALILNPEIFSYLLVRISPDDIPEALEFLRKEWQQIAPSTNFKFTFLKDDIDRQYKKDQRWFSTIRFSAIFALCLASLGAFGLTTLSMTQRSQEIGIRKVLGASVNQLMVLLSKDFIKLVILTNVIAWPIAYYTLSAWLQVFAYRIDLILPMAVGSGLTLIVVAVTVSIQTYRAATDHPVNALRHE
ncbi:MAG: FtsX-like permease family protein [Gemmatimonadetes bacterium]|nr:FtsX-like permease family protein [Gemmatimonadota bacterium]